MANGTDTTSTTFAAPTADQQIAVDQYDASIGNVTSGLDSLSTIGSTVNGVFGAISNQFAKLGASFNSLSGMTGETATKFGLITTSVIGATEAFTRLSNVDTSRLITFRGQIEDLYKVVKAGPGTQLAADAIGDIVGKMKDLGASSKQTSSVVGDLKKGVVSSAMAFFDSADNIVRLQNALMQTTIQGSGAKVLFEGIPGVLAGVGEGFSNLDEVTTKYRGVLASATTALGGNQEAAAEYMAQINRMPGGLKALLEPTTGIIQGTSLLTDSIYLAIGAGRKQEDVFKDMSQAMTQYNVSGQDALKFSSRMTEVANALGAQVSDVQNALGDSADAFKMFVTNGSDATKMTQGMASAMEEYVSQLTSVGVPAQNAIEMFKNYTGVMKNMTLGQQAFVSSMSGGPGGLRGAFAMDAMMKRGDFEGVKRQVEQTIRKMTGPIVSLDEAQKSEGAAAQYARQIQLLQSGPLGAMAKTRPEAEALLQSMKEGTKTSPASKTVDQSMLDTMKHGQKWQEGTFNFTGRAATSLKNLELMAGQNNLSTARRATGATGILGGGGGGTGAGISLSQQERARKSQEIAKGPMTDANILESAGSTVSGFTSDIGDMIKSIHESVSGNAPQAQTAQEYMPAGKRVGRAIPTGKEHETGARGTHAMNAANVSGGHQAPIAVTLSKDSAITVNFTGKCPHCGRDQHSTEVARTTSPQSFGAGF